MYDSDEADTTLVQEEIDELHESSDFENSNLTIVDIMTTPPSNQDYQVRLNVAHDQLSRFNPSRVGPWYESVIRAYQYANISDKTAMQAVVSKVNDQLPQSVRLEYEDNDTHDILKKKLIEAFEPDRKDILQKLMSNKNLGAYTACDYLRLCQAALGTDSEITSHWFLKVLPEKLQITAQSMLLAQKTLEEIATWADQMIKKFPTVQDEDTNSHIYLANNQNTANIPSNSSIAVTQAISNQTDENIWLKTKIMKLERELNETKQLQLNDAHARRQESVSILNSIEQLAQPRGHSQSRGQTQNNRNYHENDRNYHDNRNYHENRNYRGNNRNYSENSQNYHENQNYQGNNRNYSENNQNYHENRTSNAGGSRHRSRSRGPHQRNNDRQQRTSQTYNNYDRDRKQNIGQHETSAESPFTKRYPDGYLGSELCYAHRTYGEDCFPEVCKRGCVYHPDKICYFHITYGDRCYKSKCPAWCTYDEKNPKND